MHRFLASVAICTFPLWLAGCGQRPDANSADTVAASHSDSASVPHDDANDEVSLEIVNYEQIQQRIASKRGKVVVLDAWSTSCPPCMKEFHNLVELHKQYGPDAVACISLSFDYEGLDEPEKVRPAVLEFLKAQEALFDNLMSNEESDELYRKFQLNSVPAVFVYDREGNLRRRFESEEAYDQVRELVAELIGETTSDSNATPAAPAKPNAAESNLADPPPR